MNRFFLPLLCASIGFSSPVWAQTPACCNILTNGDFEQGYTEFTSGLAQSCACVSNSHCVSTNFQVKCAGWDNVPDHTSGSGNFLIIDGSTGGGVDVWRKSTPIQANVNYCFSFWVVSQYDQAFDLELTVDGVTVPGATFPVQQGSPVWTQYSLNFSGISGSVLAIRQVTAGAFRDFGIDDIEFGAPLMANFAFTPDAACGLNVSFFNQSIGQSPLTYAWNFDDPNSGNANVSTQPNPTHTFTACGNYNVCLEVSKGGCTDLICQSIQVEDLEPPTALCSGISIELDANCSAILTPGLIDGGSSDNCGIAFMSVSPSLITGCGFYPITLTVTDLCENTSECTVGVLASESVPPTLDCPPNLSVQGSVNPQGICTGIMPQLNIGAVDNCGTVAISSVPAQGSVLSAGPTVVVVTGEDECGNTDTCSTTITVFCETGVCACPAGGSSGPNLITNGSFTLGDVGFGSLPLGCACGANTHCVLPKFTDKCPGWTANFYDHTYGNNPLSQFLVIDGNPNAAADVWTNQVNVSPGKTYCFSFWVASVYTQQFDLGVTLGGVLVTPTATYTVNSTGWTQYSITWVNASLSGLQQIAIRQMTGGAQRDFGLDDICMREVCEADFTFQNLDNCGKVQFTSTSTGPAPLQYCWDFDGDPTTCESTLPNPMWQFSTCESYNVCLTISGNGCVATICQTVVIVDNTPPIASCVGGLSIIMNANCTASLSPNDVNLGSSDECPFQLSISQSTFTQCGVYPVVLTVTDWCGNTSTCSAPINVVEMVPPVIDYCPNNVAVVGTIGPNGLCTAYVVPFPTPFASDNCDPFVVLTNNAPPSGFFPAGATAVTWTATDDCGNTATCSYNIYVGCDSCACDGPPSQNLVANGNFTLGNVGFSSGLAWDNGAGCAAGRYGVYPNIGAFCSGWGPLAAASPPNFLALDGSVAAGPTVLWQTPVSLTNNTDYCFSLKWSVGFQHPFQTFPISIDIVDLSGIPIPGVTAVGNFVVTGAPGWVNYSVNWNSGTLSSGQYYIAIRQLTGDDYRDWAVDDICFTKAVAPCETAISVTQNTDCTVTVSAVTSGPQPVTYQWCDGHIGPSYTTQVLPCVPMTYCVTATCSDGSTSTASVVYTATDATPPVAVCNLGIGLDLKSDCSFQVTPADVDGGSTDNCGIQSMSVSPTVLQACTTTTVTLTVTDYCGNTSTCSMGIQTAESEPPTITCPPNVSANAIPSSCAIVVNGISFLSANDNCGFPGITHTVNSIPVASANASGTTFNQGTSVVVYTATDACDNTATCSFTVTVSCNEENCACPSGGTPSPNLIANGDFSSGAAGFTSALSGPSTGCSTGSYGVIQNFSAFCSGWQNYGASSAPNFLVIDGSSTSGPTVLWRSAVNLNSNTDYCFSFKWALGFAHPSQNFPISVDIVDASGVVIQSGGGHIGDETIANNLTWTPKDFSWNSGTLPAGPLFVVIRQLSGGLYRDFGIDDICFKEEKDDCVEAPPGMVAWWPMDEQVGDDNVADIVHFHEGDPKPNGFVGSPDGPDAVPGKVGGALHYISVPAPSRYVEVGDAPDLNFGAGSFSIDAWVNTASGTQTEPIVDKFGANNGYAFSIQGALPTLIIGQGSTYLYLQGPPIVLNDWNFVAVTVNPQTATFYVGNVTNGFTQSSSSTGNYNASNPNLPLLIGKNPVNPHWDIIIDELEMFDRDLSEAEVKSIWAADTLGKCKDVVAVYDPIRTIPLRIFPNPNAGTFTVELPEVATSGMYFRIIGLTGQILREQLTQTGQTLQTVDAGDLPAGLYFLQAVSKNQVIAIEKFVKQ